MKLFSIQVLLFHSFIQIFTLILSLKKTKSSVSKANSFDNFDIKGVSFNNNNINYEDFFNESEDNDLKFYNNIVNHNTNSIKNKYNIKAADKGDITFLETANTKSVSNNKSESRNTASTTTYMNLVLKNFLIKNYNENNYLNTLTSINNKLNIGNDPGSKTDINNKTSISLYTKRILKMRKKREIITLRVFEKIPLLGEVLSLSSVEKIGLIFSKQFLITEQKIIEKYLIMLDINPRLLKNSSELLLNILLCNWRKNELRKTIIEMIDGLCKGDDDSIIIFKEILTSVIIDYLVKREFYYQNDIESRLNLVTILNSLDSIIMPIVKIEFVNKFLKIREDLKEKLTMIILQLDTKDNVNAIINKRSHSIPQVFKFDSETKKTYIDKESLSEEEERNKSGKEIEKSAQKYFVNKKDPSVIPDQFRRARSRILDNNIKQSDSLTSPYFKQLSNRNSSSDIANGINLSILSKNNTVIYSDPDKGVYFGIKIEDFSKFKFNRELQKQLSLIKELIKNEYSEFTVNVTSKYMPNIENNYIHISERGRSIYPGLKKHIEQLLNLNYLLDPFDASKLNDGEIKVIIGGSRMKVKTNSTNINITNNNKEIEENELSRDKYDINTIPRLNNNNINAFKNRDILSNKLGIKSNNNINNYRFKSFTKESISQIANEHNLNKAEINEQLNNLNNHPDMNKINEILNSDNKNLKIVYPKEIHSKYKSSKQVPKTVIVDENIKEKQILKDLITEDAYNDLLKQDSSQGAKPEYELKNNPSIGLFTILNNIQQRKCSCGYICIELGVIIGDFDSLNAKNKTINETEYNDVHLVIKPIIVMNNTGGDKIPEKNPIVIPDIKLDDDCDDLILSGNYGITTNNVIGTENVNNRNLISNISGNRISKANSNSNNNDFQFKFKQNSNNAHIETSYLQKDSSVSFLDNSQTNNYDVSSSQQNKILSYSEFNLQEFISETHYSAKYYRKISIGEQIYSLQIFKQGMNIIIVNRDKNYNKEYEETFDTNSFQKHSEKLASLIKKTSCNKIIIITAIGKWLGAVTPSLVKEIKQIGGPDINQLINFYTQNGDDLFNTTKHSFLLIGRKGLCRYNGVFKMDNFEFDIKNEVNDCYFDDLSLEHSRINTKKHFFSIVYFRMNININKDSRFNYKAPTVSSVSPSSGSIHGGLEIKIGGFNFGYHTTEIKNVFVKNVLCGDVLVLSPNLISCITRASTIMGAGPGIVNVVLRNGLSTPSSTCFNFMYVGDKEDAVDDYNRSIRIIKKMEGKHLPIFLNSKTSDDNVKVFDNLLFDNINKSSGVISKDKRCFEKERKGISLLKVESLVKNNYENIINMVNDNKNDISSLNSNSSNNGIFSRKRKSRFLNILDSLS